jgi:glycosyltransferase involved in cell wall biosynthesis
MKHILDIIITTHNDSSYLLEAALSALGDAKSRERLGRLIVVDDGSQPIHRDNVERVTHEITKQFPRTLLLTNETACGLSHARNVGLRHCTSPYTTFLDADDLKPVGWHSMVYDHLLEHGPDLLCTRSRLNDDYHTIAPFYDYFTFNALVDAGAERVLVGAKRFCALLLEPQVGNKYFRTDTLKQLMFPTSRKYEDIQVLSRLLLAVKTVHLGSYTTHLYNTVERPFRITLTPRHKFDIIANLDSSIRLYNKAFAASSMTINTYEREFAFACMICGYIRMIDWALHTIDLFHTESFALRAAAALRQIPQPVRLRRFIGALVPDEAIRRYEHLLGALHTNPPHIHQLTQSMHY